MIKVGDRLPEATFRVVTDDGVKPRKASEVFTGKRAFGEPAAESLRTRGDRTPSRPSSVVKDLDPIIEKVILRCLETEPSARPATALAVAGAMPGGDPLAAALAAGETPSPQMVANNPVLAFQQAT